jgi:anthranilate phosphoribosyltransferase
LRDMGSKRAWVVHANDGLDEISTMGPTRVSELKGGEIRTWELDPRMLGIHPPDLAELKAEGPEHSAEMVFKAISGGPSPMRDIAQLNAAAALVITGISPDLPSAWTRAGAAVESGAARKTLERLIEATR